MNDKNNSSKQILLSVLGVAILVVAVVGVSFAAFSFTGTGTKENKITTGTITMNYTSDTNGISIDDALPTTDTAGKQLSGDDKTFDFTVSATMSGTTTINYAIAADKDESQSTLQDSDVKIYLEELDGVKGSPKEEQDSTYNQVKTYAEDTQDTATTKPEGQMTLYKGSFTNSDSKYFRLRMWLSDQYNPQDEVVEGARTAKKFVIKVNVYAAAAAVGAGA